MTQDEIIELAIQAGMLYMDYIRVESMNQLEAFAKLVVAKATASEREACAKVAERFEPDEKTSYVTYASTAIRARGEQA
jgi:hypothetical protein